MKKAKPKKPKPRKVWAINPKTRVKKSEKAYSRTEARKQARKILKRIDWFGEK